jgi:hypothetical protein
MGSKGGSKQQPMYGGMPQQQPMYGGMPQIPSWSMDGGFLGGGRGGGRGGMGFPNRSSIPMYGTQPQQQLQAGKGGLGTRTLSRPAEPAPRRSLMDQYAGLNQGVREFEPLGIRGYTPPVYTQPMGGGWNPFQYNAFGGLDTFQSEPTIPTPPTPPTPPIFPPISPWEPNPWEPNPWDDREQMYGGPDFNMPFEPQMPFYSEPRIPPRFGGPIKPFQTNYDRLSYAEPVGEPFGLPIPQTGGGFPLESFDPNLGRPKPIRQPRIPSFDPNLGPSDRPFFPSAPVMPIQGLTADTTMYQPNLPFDYNIPESIGSPMPEPTPEPVMPERFGIGIEQEVIENNPVLARRARDRARARARAGAGGGGWAGGGLIKLQEGGVVDGGMKLEEEVIAAVLGQHPNPDEVFKRYIDAYGEEGLMELLSMIEQMIPQQGRMVDGAGGGLDDAIPAMIDGEQPAALSKDEYVIPADVVAHAGDGSSDAGGRKFDNLVSRVRKEKTGTPVQPQGMELEEVAEGVIV